MMSQKLDVKIVNSLESTHMQLKRGDDIKIAPRIYVNLLVAFEGR